LTEHVNWNFLRTTLALKSARIEVVERDQLRARDMRGGELARGADIKKLGGRALRQQVLEFKGFDGSFNLQCVHKCCITI
jgi:hypothetical protein